MIKRAFFVTVVLFLLYNLCLVRASFRDHFAVQSQWQENIAKAQGYLLLDQPHPYVLVGSSLFGRLTEDDLGPGFRNLSFLGGSLFTGLELVARKPADTKVVFIETNMVLRDTDGAILDNVFRPGFSQLRPYLPALWEKCQPANLIAGKIGDKLISGGISLGSKFVSVSDREIKPIQNNSEAFMRALEGHAADYAQPPAEQLLHTRMENLRAKVLELERRGIRCVFVEMPVDRSLIELPMASKVRAAFSEYFPVSRYTWILPQEGRKYVTTDGLHLNGEEARLVAMQIRQAASGG